MSPIDETGEKRRQFLQELFEQTGGGSFHQIADMYEVGKRLGFETSQTERIEQLLEDEQYVALIGRPNMIKMLPKGRLEVERALLNATTPKAHPFPKREFAFIQNPELRKILERDYIEIHRAHHAECWKSIIILSGSAIEAILTDLLLRDPSKAQAATRAPKHSDITRWDLADLIHVCVELGHVSPGVEKLSHAVREYRNLVHPGSEIRHKLIFGAEEAKIAIEILHIIHRDLS